MRKLLKIFIVGSLILLSSCKGLRYEVPDVNSCVLLLNTVFCINTETKIETELPIKEALGYSCYSQSDKTKLEEHGNMIILENYKFSLCKSRRCIRKVIKERLDN